MERNEQRDVADITVLGWSEDEILTFDKEERKQLAKGARKLMRQAQKQPQAKTASENEGFLRPSEYMREN